MSHTEVDSLLLRTSSIISMSISSVTSLLAILVRRLELDAEPVDTLLPSFTDKLIEILELLGELWAL